MSTLADIREQIKAILAGVSGTGVIHDYERLSTDWNKFLEFYKETSEDPAVARINGCSFARQMWQERQATIGETEVAHVFVFRRIMGVEDARATGILFDDNLEAMRAAFRDPEVKTLNGTCRTIDPDWGPMDGAVGLQGDVIEPRMFGGVLCHFAELRLCAIAAEEN
jgi:hypothetical protein